MGTPCSSTVSQVRYDQLAGFLETAGNKLLTEAGMAAKLYPALNPVLNEMFFCSRLILVEGLEDVAYIAAGVELAGRSEEFRKWGCHVVPAGGKSEIIKPLAIAKLLGIPTFVVFDADTHETRPGPITKHKKDNATLQRLIGLATPNDWPAGDMKGPNYCIWSHEIGAAVSASIGVDWATFKGEAEARYGHPGGLAKNPIAVAYALERAATNGTSCAVLAELTNSILTWAASDHQ
jgi:putative ATP-dependent endonuclease of the OLD family